MNTKDTKSVYSQADYDRKIQNQEENYVLRLYIMGMTPKCRRAIENMEEICQTLLSQRYSLEVIDLKERPKLARQEQIVAVPTLVKRLPEPLRKIVGDLSDRENVLLGLDLKGKSINGETVG
jgi:circadian clock protein KaiB